MIFTASTVKLSQSEFVHGREKNLFDIFIADKSSLTFVLNEPNLQRYS